MAAAFVMKVAAFLVGGRRPSPSIRRVVAVPLLRRRQSSCHRSLFAASSPRVGVEICCRGCPPRKGGMVWCGHCGRNKLYIFLPSPIFPICQKVKKFRDVATFCEEYPSIPLPFCKDARKIGGHFEEGPSSVQRTAFIASKNGLLCLEEGHLHIARRPFFHFISE